MFSICGSNGDFVVPEGSEDPINPPNYRPPGNNALGRSEPQGSNHQFRGHRGLAMSQYSEKIARPRLNNSRAHPYAREQRFRVSTPGAPFSPHRHIVQQSNVDTAAPMGPQQAALNLHIHPAVPKRRWAAWSERRLLGNSLIRNEYPKAVTALSASNDKISFLAFFDPDISCSVIRSSIVEVLGFRPMKAPKGTGGTVICSRWGVVNSAKFVQVVIESLNRGKVEVCVGKIWVLDDEKNHNDENDENDGFGAAMILRADIFSADQPRLDKGSGQAPQTKPSRLYPRQHPQFRLTPPSSSRVSSGTGGVTASVVRTPATSVRFATSSPADDTRHQTVDQQQTQTQHAGAFQAQSQLQTPYVQLEHWNQQAHSQLSARQHHQIRRHPNRHPQQLNEQRQQRQPVTFIYSNGGYLATPSATGTQSLYSHAAPSYSPIQMNLTQELPWTPLDSSPGPDFMGGGVGHRGTTRDITR
ncbi:Putative protein of unknown function [Podospora comata]|uniref:Uncharacterized protein n=1 Tax=Podospora comata TaxID=48703 RepID=A0ABY6SBA6_PODCO|nr:Putative protein of unknown function [Podospora comata]